MSAVADAVSRRRSWRMAVIRVGIMLSKKIDCLELTLTCSTTLFLLKMPDLYIFLHIGIHEQPFACSHGLFTCIYPLFGHKKIKHRHRIFAPFFWAREVYSEVYSSPSSNSSALPINLTSSSLLQKKSFLFFDPWTGPSPSSLRLVLSKRSPFLLFSVPAS